MDERSSERTWTVDGKQVPLAEFRAEINAAKVKASEKFRRDWGGLTPREACAFACANAHLFLAGVRPFDSPGL